MSWKLDADRQIWLQLMEILTQRVVSGEYPPGERIPSVRDLAAEAGVNPNTMQRTLAAMEDEGLLTSQRNTGRYVTQDTALLHAKRDALAQKELALFREKMKLLCYTEQEIKELLSKEETHECPCCLQRPDQAIRHADGAGSC